MKTPWDYLYKLLNHPTVEVPDAAKDGHGLIEVAPQPEDYILGGSKQARKIILSEERDYRAYRPPFETQKINGKDPYACVPFSGTNCLEIYFKKAFGMDINFSDRYHAGMIPVRPYRGTTFSKFADSLRENGLVLEEEYPWNGEDVYEYVQRPPGSIIKKGKAFLEAHDIEHEWVDSGGCDPDILYEALIYGPLQVSVNAAATYNGQRSTATNHAVAIIHAEKGKYFTILDSYREMYTVPWNFYFGSAKQYSVHLKKKAPLVKVWGDPKVYAIYGTTACHIVDMFSWQYGAQLGKWAGDSGSITILTQTTFQDKFTIGNPIQFNQ